MYIICTFQESDCPTIKRIGCYKAKDEFSANLNELILTDRDTKSSVYSGTSVQWSKWNSYLSDVACKCSKRAEELGYHMFGIQYYGECWSGSAANTLLLRSDLECPKCTGKDFEDCRTTEKYCVGKENTIFIYERSGTTTIPQPRMNPYTNYLFYPRLTFTGSFHADVSTVNNIPSNYDTENFVPSNYLKRTMTWNSRGSGEWYVNNAYVTQVCYFNGTCVANHTEDPMVDAQFFGGGNGTMGKLVDLDCNCQLFSEIWGWRVHIETFFSGHFTPVPFQYIWQKIDHPGTLAELGSSWQSVLTDLRWKDSEKPSPLMNEWKTLMKNENIESDKLSIRFNVDLIENDPKKSRFLYGRITGSVGLLGVNSPSFFTHGRMLHTQSPRVQSTPFIVDKTKKKAYVDFGNTFQITQSGSFADLNDLYVGVSLQNDRTSQSLTCDDKFYWIGKVDKAIPNWYTKTAGIQAFSIRDSLSDIGMDLVAESPLAVVQVIGHWPNIHCMEILLAEAVDGVDIHPFDDWTLREEPGKTAEVRLFATKFGEPLSNAKVHFESAAITDCPLLYEPEPPVGVPSIPPPEDVYTNKHGLAKFKIPTNDPNNPRKYIDGQVYPFVYYLEYKGSKRKYFSDMCSFKTLNQMIVIAIWDKYESVDSPTWLDHVHPIFKLYANLYPVMTKNIIDLGNYYEVVERKNIIQMSMELPISHPNYMPVTRDLSPSKRKVILNWLKNEKSPVGEPKDFYTVENLRQDLQIALQLEQATIPPYLTAYASIKYNHNEQVKDILKSIFVQEMMHMNLVANILNAVGGTPRLYYKDFVPFYPTRLPGGIQPELVVPIEKISIDLIRNVFMEIEKPGVTQEVKSIIRKSTSATAHPLPSNFAPKAPKVRFDRMVDEDLKSCLIEDYKRDSEQNFKLRQYGMSRRRRNGRNNDPRGKNEKVSTGKERMDYVFERHHNTIGNFYNHILNTLGYLTDCGRNNSIFTGDPRRQVIANEWLYQEDPTLKVTDFDSAVKAINLIVEQGEGSSPCNPMSWSHGDVKDLSHYFLFYSITEKHELQVHESLNKTQRSNSQSAVVNYTQCNGTYHFTGRKIPFDPEGVWPMIPNPSMSKYRNGTKAYLRAETFNKVYTKMLKSLQHVFNGHPERLKDTLGLMFSVTLHLKQLVQTPIDPDGDPDVGPNAGPPFDFVP